MVAPPYIDRWFKDRVLYTKLVRAYADGGDPTSTEALTRTSDALIEAGRSLDIEVSPRYGEWTPAQRPHAPGERRAVQDGRRDQRRHVR